MDIVKHKIKLMNHTPFKGQNGQIPLSMYKEVMAYLQEMLDIVTTCPSYSPWTNAVVLVRKRKVNSDFTLTLGNLMQEQSGILMVCPELMMPQIV